MTVTAGPRLFVEIEASPPTAEAYLLRAGFSHLAARPFLGLYHWGEPSEQKAGWDLQGETFVLGGILWSTTTNPRAAVIPTMGIGVSVGDYDYDLKEYDDPHLRPVPGDPVHTVGSSVTTALGLFANAGVRVPVVPERLALSGELFGNLATTTRTAGSELLGDEGVKDERIAMLSVYLMLGLAYQF